MRVDEACDYFHSLSPKEPEVKSKFYANAWKAEDFPKKQ